MACCVFFLVGTKRAPEAIPVLYVLLLCGEKFGVMMLICFIPCVGMMLYHIWLVVSSPLKNINSQNGNLPQVGMEIKIFETTT